MRFNRNTLILILVTVILISISGQLHQQTVVTSQKIFSSDNDFVKRSIKGRKSKFIRRK